jgi:hypothetical protein
VAGTRPNEGVHAISTSGVTGSRLSEIASSPSTAEPLVANLNQLAKGINSSNLSAAQHDYVTLSEDALNSAASAQMPRSATAIAASLLLDIASSSSGASTLVNELSHLGADLAGNALNDRSKVINVASTLSFSTTSSSQTESVKSIGAAQLIQEATRAIVAGDGSVVNSDLSQLASLLSEMRRINYGEQVGDSDDDVFTSSSTGDLSQTMDEDVSSLSPYDQSLIAWHLFGSVPPNTEQYGDRETRKKLRRVSSRRFEEAQWSVIVFLAGFHETDDLREALDYIFSEESLRGFAHRLAREADPAYTPKWQRKLIDEMVSESLQ